MTATPGAVLGGGAMERVGERLAQDVTPSRVPRPLRLWIGAAAATAAALAIVWVGMQPQGDEFTARGNGGTSSGELIGIRLFRLGAGATELKDGDRVRPGDSLGASYSSSRSTELRWFVRRADGMSIPLKELAGSTKAGVVDEPLESSATVDARFGAGEVVVTAIFFADGKEQRREVRLTVEGSP